MITINKRKLSRGITLIEVLVTVVVLAFGLLGLAGLQANALRNNNSAYLRSQATYLANEMMDRMRANRIEAIDNDNYDIAIGDDESDHSSGDALTQADIDFWIPLLAATLPMGDGSIACNPANNVCTITVQWDDTRTGAATQSFSTSAEL